MIKSGGLIAKFISIFKYYHSNYPSFSADLNSPETGAIFDRECLALERHDIIKTKDQEEGGAKIIYLILKILKN